MMPRIQARVTVFVNNHRVPVHAQATIREALHAANRRFLEAVEGDTAEVMDADGWPLPLDANVVEHEHVYVCLLPWA